LIRYKNLYLTFLPIFIIHWLQVRLIIAGNHVWLGLPTGCFQWGGGFWFAAV